MKFYLNDTLTIAGSTPRLEGVIGEAQRALGKPGFKKFKSTSGWIWKKEIEEEISCGTRQWTVSDVFLREGLIEVEFIVLYDRSGAVIGTDKCIVRIDVQLVPLNAAQAALLGCGKYDSFPLYWGTQEDYNEVMAYPHLAGPVGK